MQVDILWEIADDQLMQETRCLYCYLHPDTDDILYIGKAYGTSVQQRFNALDKDSLFQDVESDFGISDREVEVLVGILGLEVGRRLSRELLADIESLLIKRLQPFGNIQSKQTRISRRGLSVNCLGEWPSWRSFFRDS